MGFREKVPTVERPPAVIVNAGVLQSASVALGGVAPVPYRARQVEQYLRGKSVVQVDPVVAGSLALPDARPMADNEYKVILANNLVKRAVAQLLGTFPSQDESR